MHTARLHTASPDELRRMVAMLERKLAFATHCRHFGTQTRQGLELALEGADLTGHAIVFFDIDNLKSFNALHGQPEANRLIGQVIQARAGDLLVGQWYSGDEFVAFIPEPDALGFAQRLLSGLRAVGSSATLCMASWRSDMPTIQQVDMLTDLCVGAKTRGEKGRIYDFRAHAAEVRP